MSVAWVVTCSRKWGGCGATWVEWEGGKEGPCPGCGRDTHLWNVEVNGKGAPGMGGLEREDEGEVLVVLEEWWDRPEGL